jgi:DNA replication protein DnaC
VSEPTQQTAPPPINKAKFDEMNALIESDRKLKARRLELEKEKKVQDKLATEKNAADLAASILKLAGKARERMAEWEAFAKTQPKSVLCKLHNFDRGVDVDLSSRLSYAAGTPTMGYAPCPKCQAAEQGLDNWLLRAGVPMELVEATFENWQVDSVENAKILADVKKFASERVGFLTLLGPVGVGKSHLAVAAMKQFRCGMFIEQATLIEKLRKTYRDDRAVDIIEKAKNTRLLILDEVGISGEGKDVFPTIHSILSYRHGNYKPTILTGNLIVNKTVNELMDVLGDRLIDRLRQSSYKVLTIAGESKRAAKRSQYLGI